MLSRPYTRREIKNTLFAMQPWKALGPDGVPAGFYQKNWRWIQDDVIGAVQSALSSGILREFNFTNIALIPKCDSPDSMDKLRPIKLCNVIYKIISKCITNRLRKVINDLDSGQAISQSKSVLLASPNSKEEDVEKFSEVLGISRSNSFGIYLGIQADFGTTKKEIFGFMVDRVKERLNVWDSLFLSHAGRLTLIKFVLSSLGTYVLSVFKCPMGVLKNINSIIAKFWWLGTKDGKGVYWRNWKHLTNAKENGGLGILDARFFNQALLAKQGDECTAKIHHPWIHGNVPKWNGYYVPNNDNVASLLSSSGCWNMESCNMMIDRATVDKISTITTMEAGFDDFIIWKGDRKGVYSVKSGYKFIFAERRCKTENFAVEDLQGYLTSGQLGINAAHQSNIPIANWIQNWQHILCDRKRGLEESYGLLLAGLESIWEVRNNMVFRGNKQDAGTTIKLMELKVRAQRISNSSNVGKLCAGTVEDYPPGFEAEIKNRIPQQLEERDILIVGNSVCATISLDIQQSKCRSRTQWSWKLIGFADSSTNVEKVVKQGFSNSLLDAVLCGITTAMRQNLWHIKANTPTHNLAKWLHEDSVGPFHARDKIHKIKSLLPSLHCFSINSCKFIGD
uniref:Reverse transcriptase n=1 Tax=Chenopodium quinoa TaxID=63459 RepID=A0A803MYV5_CHEQI